MDVRQLRYFVATVDCGSFVGAAASLRVAQPAISRQVMLLEESLGERLLERSVRGVRLTAAGEVVYARAQVILQHVRELEAQFKGTP